MTSAAGGGLAGYIWETRYRDPGADPPETGLEDSWRRVARAAAAVERDPGIWAGRFLALLRDCRFLPAGRILAGAGASRATTLFNCFVLGPIEDAINGVHAALAEAAQTMQMGGGIGHDFSTLAPRGQSTPQGPAPGIVAWLELWDAMCRTVTAAGTRRGAMMATLRCDHPDVLEFIQAKRHGGGLSCFNLSVLVSDALLEAVERDADWPLAFPAGGAVHRVVRARELWQTLCDSAHASAEPGVLFIDRINAANNLGYCETISATNPCGEEPLPPYGACNLGSLNLTAYVRDPFTAAAQLDLTALAADAAVATRLLDNVIDLSLLPLARQRAVVHGARRIGLGITGLADALALLRLRYDSEAARAAGAQAMQTICVAAYRCSTELATERGPFPAFDAAAYLARPFIQGLPQELRGRIADCGIRNSHLTAIAPAGTISLLAGGVSSGIEPLFALEGLRNVRAPDGSIRQFTVTDYAWRRWQERQPEVAPVPEWFVTGAAVAAVDHLRMQAALQRWVDGAISKTIALPPDQPPAATAELFRRAWTLGLKGCTVFRAGTRSCVVAEAAPVS
ncbi:MAG: adenosylcobalamin-dependent ribonucleoside-diphosphate reductase [Gammaproteobacteria bacterium]|nr:adenosylcobalamin-dependent ribonucleoside-diphosphate reductase [Gammaproteobacteria bacterium]